VEYRIEDRMLLIIEDSMWQMRNKKMKKLIEKFIRLYKIKRIVSKNMVELELLVSMKIHLIVNMSRIAIYQEQIKRQKKIIPLPAEIDGEKKYKIENIKEK